MTEKKIGEIHQRKLIGSKRNGEDIFIDLCEYGPLRLKPGYVKDEGYKSNCKACFKIIADWRRELQKFRKKTEEDL